MAKCSTPHALTTRVRLLALTSPPLSSAPPFFTVPLPSPLQVQYLSYGERINPNLYENGKVCLSLLGTWTGRQSCELWNPQSSTVLQVCSTFFALLVLQMRLHVQGSACTDCRFLSPHNPHISRLPARPAHPPPPRVRLHPGSHLVRAALACPPSRPPLIPSPPQVLVSIQALVLCEQPYYNEAGYERQLGTSDGAHHARRYNEGALLLSLKSMSTSLRNSAEPFNGLIALHFSTASKRILRRCAWLLTLKKPLEQAALASAAANAAAGSSSAIITSTPASTAAGASPSGATNVASSGADASPTQPVAGGATVSDTASIDGGADAATSAEPMKSDASMTDGAAGGADAVSRAGLAGVLNPQPTLGFLHSLDRVLPALERSFAEARRTAEAGK